MDSHEISSRPVLQFDRSPSKLIKLKTSNGFLAWSRSKKINVLSCRIKLFFLAGSSLEFLCLGKIRRYALGCTYWNFLTIEMHHLACFKVRNLRDFMLPLAQCTGSCLQLKWFFFVGVIMCFRSSQLTGSGRWINMMDGWGVFWIRR